jgi:hypothetical protein
MTKKFKIYGIGNEKRFSYYVVDKFRKVVEFFNKSFKEIFNVNYSLIEESCDTKLFDRFPEKKVDMHESIGGLGNNINSSPRVDLFYGKERIYLTIYSEWDLRKKFNESLSLNGEIIHPKKLNKSRIK